MEEVGVERIVAKMRGDGEGSMRRTQSNLELLSETALEDAANTEEEHGEELSSNGSGDTAHSARVTPSVSQLSFVGAGATNSEIGVSLNSRAEGGGGIGDNSFAKSGVVSHSGAVAAPLGFIPSSPYQGQTHCMSGSGDTTGLPIDHYTITYTAPQPPLIPTFLSESFLPQPHYYPAGTPIPSSASVLTRPVHQFAGTTFPSHHGISSVAPSLAAAFVPPRSSAVRLSPSNEAGQASMSTTQSQYILMPSAVVRHTHYQNSLHHHYPQGHNVTTVSVGACESFQSDSTTVSVISDLQLKPSDGNKKQLGNLQGFPVDKPKEKRARSQSASNEAKPPTYAELEAANLLLQQQNTDLKHELEKRHQEVAVLRDEVRDLDLKVRELRQFPAGKISQIPMADMLEIMQIYGSEVSDTVMPPRKLNIQKASVIRQFRRWNPNFLKHFHFKDGKWIPKLGREGEIARRHLARKKVCNPKGKRLNANDFEEDANPSPSPSEDTISLPPSPKSSSDTASMGPPLPSKFTLTPTKSPLKVRSTGDSAKRKLDDLHALEEDEAEE